MSALGGIRILDFSRILAGPFCTMLLSDFGAEVIKVEHPRLGDDTRAWGPPWIGPENLRLSAYFASVNRNKLSLTLDLKSVEGQALARQLALRSDVLVENFKVGQMRAYGLDYERLHAEHPGLIYCSITGYGQSGPYAAQPGYDYLIQGQSGLMSITGPEAGPPYKVGVAVADVFAGLFAANAIQAALFVRQRSGEGQYIDIALLDAQIAALVNVASNYLVSRQPPRRYGNAHPNIVPYEAFEAADGPFILAVGNDEQFRRACAVLGRPDLAEDARFATNPARVTHRAALIAILKPLLAARRAASWIEAFLAAGVPAGPIHDIASALADPQVVARGLVQSVSLPASLPVSLPDGSALELIGPVAQLSGTPAQIRRAPPTLGQDTEAILRDLLALDDATVADLRRRQIV